MKLQDYQHYTDLKNLKTSVRFEWLIHVANVPIGIEYFIDISLYE